MTMLPTTGAESYAIGTNKEIIYAYGCQADDENPARCLISVRAGALSADIQLTPSEARDLAAMLIAAADYAKGMEYRAKYWRDAINRERYFDTLIADANEQLTGRQEPKA